LSDWVIISSGCSSRSSRLDPGSRFSSLGDETSICTTIAATIFVHLIPSGNRGIGMSLFERKGQLTLLFGSYSRKSKKSGVFFDYKTIIMKPKTILRISYFVRDLNWARKKIVLSNISAYRVSS
jgi:hypothetical protein